MVNMPYQNQILRSSWLTSRNATPSIGSLYKLPTLFAPFLFCDVIADKVYSGCFSVPIIALVVDIKEGRGQSIKMHPQLQPKKTKVRLY